MFKAILVANDGSDGGFRALKLACDLARHHKAKLSMIAVEHLPDFAASIDEVIESKEMENHKYHDVLAKAGKIAAAKRVKLKSIVVAGHPAKAIAARLKKEKADLLVIGFAGHSALYERIIGSTADRLLRLSPCSVLVVK
jgi:nucleotide-binding universal stress UspA family protein